MNYHVIFHKEPVLPLKLSWLKTLVHTIALETSTSLVNTIFNTSKARIEKKHQLLKQCIGSGLGFYKFFKAHHKLTKSKLF